MDYNLTARQILDCVGGKDNIISGMHCATRLRLVIADNSKVNKHGLEEIDGVSGVFEASGQLQIVLGTGAVNKVFDEFVPMAGIKNSSSQEVKRAAANKMPWYKRAVKTLGDVFVPIIPAIVASGLLMGLLEGLANIFPTLSESGTYTVIHLFSNAAFVFLPILIAVSAAKVFGGNPYLGAVIGMIMIHTDLMNAWSVASAETVPTASVWFGLYDINLVGYQGHVIPVIIAVWFMSMLEKRLHKIVPEIIDLFVTPLVTVLTTGYLTLTVFGPVFSWLENGILSGVQWLVAIPFGIGSAICGAIYAPTVVAGIHHMYNALEAGLLSSTGYNIWMPIATAANVAQGAAALAFALKTHNKKQKSIALPASLSAFLGITEPAIFGVNLRFWKPFLAGCVGGAAGGLVAGILKVSATAYGITGLFGFLITTHNFFGYLLVMAAAFAVSFILTAVMYRDKEEKGEEETDIILSPVEGNIIKLEKVDDETFASGTLGYGIAVEPTSNKIVAPADAHITTLFDAKHAIGLRLTNGAEVLIHIGINTVNLDGKGFTSFVSQDEDVKRGQTLIEFDRDLIEKEGYKTTTSVIVTNSSDYKSVEPLVTGKVNPFDRLIEVKS